ncbi:MULTISPECIES: DUF502 domain-containing protein [Shewanella]|uniref:DUF502 domain-containing protein n=1 Tax=Shewanella xiamenensis TaxID=332186 RepID=A0AAE4TM53_9GAMM|nr:MULTISPECIES: DUF502 domain-containing protein [Shewanella]MCH7424245.1 DUF502 domain-containing protein [Shewanella sp. MM_2022_3]MDV5389680.1 DUF502 domain-containing protein [Shewanella xiamenensis]PHY63015.1 hypothetical protein CS023_14285 [Shewanella xiamenensis]UML92407.1 DUF502 domain-containing protein [Shewanella xiamenensis]
MKKTLARGLMNLLPMALSLWLFWSLFVSLDGLGIFILELVGINQHFVGAGFILVVAIVFAVGLLFSVSPIVWLYGWIERQLMRFPLFKSVYGSIRDIASLMNREGKPNTQQTVLVKQANGGFVVGFIMTDTPPQPLLDALPEGDWVPVLFQLSYQMAGVTSLVKREDLILVDWSFEEAMRFNLTAGISQTPGATTVKTKAE